MKNVYGSEVSSKITPAVRKRTTIWWSFFIFTTICCIDCEKFHSGSDGVPSFTLDQNSSSSDKENWLYQKHKLLDPIPDYTTPFKKTTKLNLQQQQEIIIRRNTGASLRELAGDFGVSYETIRTVIKRQAALINSSIVSKTEVKGEL